MGTGFADLPRWATGASTGRVDVPRGSSGHPLTGRPGEVTWSPRPRPWPPPVGCRLDGAVHLGAQTHGTILSLHVRPGPSAWRRVDGSDAAGLPGELAFALLRRVSSASGAAPVQLTIGASQAAQGAAGRDERMGLPAPAGSIVQVDTLGYAGLGTCTRSLRFDPDGAGELSSTLRLLWRLGPGIDVVLTASAPRADELFAALPDVDRFADSVEICPAQPA